MLSRRWGRSLHLAVPIISCLGCTLFRSTNGGVDWTLLYKAPFFSHPPFVSGASITTVVEAARASGVLYLGANSTNGLLAGSGPLVQRSSDDGAHWTSAAVGLPSSTDSTLSLMTLAIDPTDANTLYAGTVSGVFKTANGGTSWSRASNGLPTAPAVVLAVNPQDANVVYAVIGGPTFASGVFVTTDGGASWTARSHSLGNAKITGLALDISNPSTLYVSTSTQGVFRSIDSAMSWTARNAGLLAPGSLEVNGITVDPIDGRNLFAATNAGAFTLQIDETGTLASVVEFYNASQDHGGYFPSWSLLHSQLLFDHPRLAFHIAGLGQST